MSSFNAPAVVRAANADYEFCYAARQWNTAVRLCMGDQDYLVKVSGGRIVDFSSLKPGEQAKCDLRISAPLDDWREFLKPVPKPFYLDLISASVRHGFQFEGDLIGCLYPYYRAISRLFEIMRTTPNA